MNPIKFYILILFCACLVKCDETTRTTKNMNGKILEKSELEKICSKKTCILKCCPPGYVITYYFLDKCVRKEIAEKINNVNFSEKYDLVDVYSLGRTFVKTAKNISESPFYIIHDDVFQQNGSSIIPVTLSSYHLIEDGTLATSIRNRYNRYTITKNFDFCVDVQYNVVQRKGNLVFKVLIAGSDPSPEMQESINKYMFTAITFIISCFFLLLTLLVYVLLPHLRTIGGKILMALISTLTLSYALKATINMTVIPQEYNENVCRVITTLYYFAINSSFFWMNVMSFNLFWTLRGTRKSREIHRRGETHKFIMYCLYAYGLPIILTATAAVIDNVDVGPDIIKPFFNTCQNNREESALYLFIPIGILVLVNCVLFLLTTYNIWMTNRGVVNFNKESRNTKRSENGFGLYLKLSIIMGVGWILECIQFAVDVPFWLYIILNAYNVLIGVAIFFLFVFKKKILKKLCTRLNIKSSFVDNMQKSQYSRTETSRTPGSTKSNTSLRNYNIYTKSPENAMETMSTIAETCID